MTGDHPRTATAIGREIGLIQSDRPTVLTGDQLRRLSIISLQLALDEEEIIFARVAADQKMRIVEALINKKHVVAVTGDGVNDAPALKAAHIGIAMGVTGSDVAKEAADMILIDDNFASIVNAVEEGRAVFQNIRKFLTYVLVHNVAELVPFLAFVLFRIRYRSHRSRPSPSTWRLIRLLRLGSALRGLIRRTCANRRARSLKNC